MCVVSSGNDVSDLDRVFAHTRGHLHIHVCAALWDERRSFRTAFLLAFKACWSLTRGFDLPTHMLVISFSMGMFNGIQRATSDLRPATPFSSCTCEIGTSLQDWPVYRVQTRSDSIVFQTRSDQLRAARSYPSGTVVLFSVKAVLAESAGTCSVSAVPASRIPTRCVGIGCF